VAYLFPKGEEGIDQTSFVNQLEELVLGTTGVFEKYSKSRNMNTIDLVLYMMRIMAASRVNEDIKDHMDKPLIEDIIRNQKKRVVVVFFREGPVKRPFDSGLKVPEGCEWIEVNTDFINIHILRQTRLTKSAVTRLKEIIGEVCPHKDVLTSICFLLMM